MKTNRWLAAIAVTFLFFLCVSREQVWGESPEEFHFSYTNLIPENQVEKTTGNYFDLLVKPDTTQVLQTVLKNESDEELVIKINISSATTSATGAINYGPSKSKLTSQAPYQLTDMLTGPTQVTLGSGESRTVDFTLTTPKTLEPGFILGGIHLSEMSGKEREQPKNGVSLANKYSYVYSVRLRTTDKAPKLELEDLGLAETSDGLTYGIRNKTANLVRGMSIKGIVKEKDSNVVVSSIKHEGYDMAPYTDLTLPVEGELEPGKEYESELVVTVGKETWTFKDDVTKEKVTVVQENLLIEAVQKPVNVWLWGIVAILICLITVVGFYVLLVYGHEWWKNREVS